MENHGTQNDKICADMIVQIEMPHISNNLFGPSGQSGKLFWIGIFWKKLPSYVHCSWADAKSFSEVISPHYKSSFLTAVFFETGAMPTPTKSRNPTNCGWGGLFQSYLTHS